MALVVWDDSYSVQVEKCDVDHRQLVSLLNRVHDAVVAGRDDLAILQVLDELAEYATFHFWREELLMEQTQFAGLRWHRVEHGEFVERVKELQHDLSTGKCVTPLAVSLFLQQWLTKHIKETDQAYASHLNAHGVH